MDETEGEGAAPQGLEAVFRRLIGATGPISVAHYMAEANAHYYNRADPLGTTGDFITAPEISQMFGEMIGLWLADQWQQVGKPALCHFVEFGPGRGTLAADALRAMEQFDFRPKVHLIEGSSALRMAQKLSVPGATWHDGLDSVPREGPLLIVANEFLDALPCARSCAPKRAGASGWWCTMASAFCPSRARGRWIRRSRRSSPTVPKARSSRVARPPPAWRTRSPRG